MPNHIHILIKQFDDIDKIIKCIKAKTALRLNAKLNKKGSFWQKGYYDKVIRDEKHFERVYNYIYNNPIKAKLKDWERRVYSLYEQWFKRTRMNSSFQREAMCRRLEFIRAKKDPKMQVKLEARIYPCKKALNEFGVPKPDSITILFFYIFYTIKYICCL